MICNAMGFCSLGLPPRPCTQGRGWGEGRNAERAEPWCSESKDINSLAGHGIRPLTLSLSPAYVGEGTGGDGPHEDAIPLPISLRAHYDRTLFRFMTVAAQFLSPGCAARTGAGSSEHYRRVAIAFRFAEL